MLKVVASHKEMKHHRFEYLNIWINLRVPGVRAGGEILTMQSNQRTPRDNEVLKTGQYYKSEGTQNPEGTWQWFWKKRTSSQQGIQLKTLHFWTGGLRSSLERWCLYFSQPHPVRRPISRKGFPPVLGWKHMAGSRCFGPRRVKGDILKYGNKLKWPRWDGSQPGELWESMKPRNL